MKYELFESIGIAENAIDKANLLVHDVHKFTRREYQAIFTTLNKVQHLAENVMAVAQKKKQKVRLIVNGDKVRFNE